MYGKFDNKQGVLSDFLIKDADKSIVKIVKNRIDGAKTVKTEYKVLKEKAESFEHNAFGFFMDKIKSEEIKAWMFRLLSQL